MFRKMRRFGQEIPETESVNILKNCTSGVLSLMGENGYPYGVPMAYVYDEGRIIFHSAMDGHKIDAIKFCDKASFCVTAMDNVIPEKFTTVYKSVIVFGKVRMIEDAEEKLRAIRILSDKYSPGMEAMREKEIAGSFNRMHVIELTIEHMTGKEAVTLMAQRKK